MNGDRLRGAPTAALLRRISRRLILAVAVTVWHGFLFASVAFAQATVDSLTLRGEVLRSELQRQGEENYYHLKLRLEFVNTGQEPIILLMGTYGEPKHWWVLDASLAYSVEEALAGKVFYGHPAGPANSSSLPSWRRLRRKLSTRVPPRSVTRIIKPKERFVS